MKHWRKLTIVIPLFIIIGIAYALFTLYRSNLELSSCKNPTKLEDYSNKQKRLVICKDSIIYGKEIVTTGKQNPELFYNKSWILAYEAVIYSADKKDFIAIFPVINAMTWYTRAGYIFEKENNKYTLIFDKKFKNLTGRWTGVRFDENGSIFDPSTIVINQDLGVLGALGNVIRWSDYYEWDNTQNTYILANNKQTFRLDEKKKEYDEQDLTACGNETSSLIVKKLSELYPTRKEMDPFCLNDNGYSYTSKEDSTVITGKEVTIFMKARKAIEEIRKGKNISINDIKKIEL